MRRRLAQRFVRLPKLENEGSAIAGTTLHLEHGIVDHWRWIGIERRHANVRGNTDDRENGPATPCKVLADGICAREVLFCESFADYGDIGRSAGIAISKVAAAKQRDAHGLKVAGTDERVLRPVEFVRRRAFNP